ncbi:MAG: phosphotransferase [FCB group bacterium]|nr:phosphotransferase [FCB group bacterium]
MDRRSVEIFDKQSEYILAEAAGCFGVAPSDLQKLGSFESYVYEYVRDGSSYILKLTHSLHRTMAQIEGELEWINFLADNGVPVGRAFPATDGQLPARIDLDDSYFLAYSFGKSSGAHITKDDWNEKLFIKWGRLTGRMHALAKMFSPSDRSRKRFEWHEDESLKVEKYIPADQEIIIEKCNSLKGRLRKLDTDDEAYGLIHSDLHHGNFFINNGDIIPFDFDDCHYNWFAYDLGIPLFYALRSTFVTGDKMAFAEKFMSAFMTGYNEENKLAAEWFKYIPYFMKMREMDLYIIIHAEGAFLENKWCSDYMEGRREKIENDIPVIDLDFSRFAV